MAACTRALLGEEPPQKSQLPGAGVRCPPQNPTPLSVASSNRRLQRWFGRQKFAAGRHESRCDRGSCSAPRLQKATDDKKASLPATQPCLAGSTMRSSGNAFARKSSESQVEKVWRGWKKRRHDVPSVMVQWRNSPSERTTCLGSGCVQPPGCFA